MKIKDITNDEIRNECQAAYDKLKHKDAMICLPYTLSGLGKEQECLFLIDTKTGLVKMKFTGKCKNIKKGGE